MPLRIAGKPFSVTRAVLGGVIHHKSWQKFDPTIGAGVDYSLEIESAEKSLKLDGRACTWKPHLEFGRFGINAKEWPSIESTSLRRVEGAGFLDAHDEAVAVEISFGRRTGARFQTRVEGKVRGLDFTFTGPVLFVGYRCVGTARDTDETLTKMLAKHVALFALEAEEMTVREQIPGRKMSDKNFRPGRVVKSR